jgi:alkaline phosphatase D
MTAARRDREGLYESFEYGPPGRRVQLLLLDQVRKIGPTSALYRCVPTGMCGPTCTFWANLTPCSLQRWFRSPFKDAGLAARAAYAEGKQRYLPNPDPSLTVLGAAQWGWLEEQLLRPAQVGVRSHCRFINRGTEYVRGIWCKVDAR